MNIAAARDAVAAALDQLRVAGEALSEPPLKNITLVKVGDNLNAAWKATIAMGGGIIDAEPGEYPVDPLLLSARNSTAVVQLRTSAKLPDTRVDPAALSSLVRLKPKAATSPLVVWDAGGAGYSFDGVEFSGVSAALELIRLGGDEASMKTPAERPRDVLFDRCLFQGDPTNGQRAGIVANALNVSIRRSRAIDIFSYDKDAQAVVGWNGSENILIEDCDVDGAGENIIFGGANAASQEMQPRNIRVLRSRLAKPFERWRQLPNFAKIHIKALCETKNVDTFELGGCLLEQNAADDWPQGVAVAIKSSNGDGGPNARNPWANTTHARIQNCIIRNVGQPWMIVGQNDGTLQNPTARMTDVEIENVLIYNVGVDPWLGTARGLDVTTLPHDFTVDHITQLGTRHSFLSITSPAKAEAADGKGQRFRLTNSVLVEGSYGLIAAGKLGTAALAIDAPDAVVTGNAIRNDPDRVVKYPDGNLEVLPPAFAASFDKQQRVLTGSAVAGAVTTDGRRVGADVDQIAAALASSDRTAAGLS